MAAAAPLPFSTSSTFASTANFPSATIPSPSPPAPRATKSTSSTPASPGASGSRLRHRRRKQRRRRHHPRSSPARLHRSRPPTARSLTWPTPAPTPSPSSTSRPAAKSPDRRRRRARCRCASLPTARPWSSPTDSGNSRQLLDPASRHGPRRLRGLPRRGRRRHPARLVQGLCRLLRRPPGHGHRPRPLKDRPTPSQPDRLEALLDVGRAPVQLALKPDGGEIFVSNSLSDSISEVYHRHRRCWRRIHDRRRPRPRPRLRDNSLLYVANFAPSGSPSTPSTTAAASAPFTSATVLRRWRFPALASCSWSSIPAPPMSPSSALPTSSPSPRRHNPHLHRAPHRPRPQRHRRESLQAAINCTFIHIQSDCHSNRLSS